MVIDFHVHERTFSDDSHMNLKEIVNEAKMIGLDGVCITDHDAFGLVDYAAKISRQENFPIFVGVEYLTPEGDITAFGINRMPDRSHMPAQDFIDYVRAQGGVCISAHPFRSNSRGLGEELDVLQGLTGIEVLNGSTSMAANKKAMEYCERLNLQPIGASDAHNLIALGRYATEISEEVHTVEELVNALKTGTCKPVIRHGYREKDGLF
ncbi:PHP-associated domain-containing protein [Hespellia stercorisuis]|uniref:Polymerase/histidinol phosphatase N-terminal domain-containing protein n=1 Tax=Hespellia stercorisuis DSM 15480 TaxID=1121950 RepID=A0A1M6V2N6_9FIRM|nr:PHP domain-containing protein [Hespellia stercorisuis]SHK75759.1 hypothetical protein SAMN02745243_03672 [Hespellia stercorisuis DSM 15480]